jgi:hypothetical protein
MAMMAGVLICGVQPPAQADSQRACEFLGTWFGFNVGTGYADWLSTANGFGHSAGTYLLETTVDAPTLQFLFSNPNLVRHSIFRGDWRRIDRNTFEITVISIVYDSADNAVGIMKVNARDTLDETCNTMYIEPELKLYPANENPFEDAPFFEMPLTPHYGHRTSVDPYTE